VKIDDNVKPVPPNLTNQTGHLSQCAPHRPITHRNPIHCDHFVYLGTEIREWRTSVSCQECQPGIGKRGFQRTQCGKQKDDISEPRKADRQDLHGRIREG
jgi:hypothetical protein